MSANISAKGVVRTLDRAPEAHTALTERDVQQPSTLVRLFAVVLRELARMGRRWAPQRTDFEDRPVDSTGTTLYRFEHRFGGPVRYWPVGWIGTAAPCLSINAASDDNTLILTSKVAGTVTLRVEEAG